MMGIHSRVLDKQGVTLLKCLSLLLVSKFVELLTTRRNASLLGIVCGVGIKRTVPINAILQVVKGSVLNTVELLVEVRWAPLVL